MSSSTHKENSRLELRSEAFVFTLSPLARILHWGHVSSKLLEEEIYVYRVIPHLRGRSRDAFSNYRHVGVVGQHDFRLQRSHLIVQVARKAKNDGEIPRRHCVKKIYLLGCGIEGVEIERQHILGNQAGCEPAVSRKAMPEHYAECEFVKGRNNEVGDIGSFTLPFLLNLLRLLISEAAFILNCLLAAAERDPRGVIRRTSRRATSYSSCPKRETIAIERTTRVHGKAKCRPPSPVSKQYGANPPYNQPCAAAHPSKPVHRRPPAPELLQTVARSSGSLQPPGIAA